MQTFWQKYQVLLTGLISAIVISLQQFIGPTPTDWKVVGFAALLAAASYAGNNWRGKGVSVLGIIGVAGYAVSSVTINGVINLNQLILAFLIGMGALIAPPVKPESYEQNPTIMAAKKAVTILILVLMCGACRAQYSFFKPLPKVHVGLADQRFSLATDSTINVFRPVAGVTAAISDGTQLAGGVGAGFQHLKWDVPSATWVPQYSISGVAFLGSNGSSADFIAGGVVGILNFVSLGYGYDFTQKRGVFLTGVAIHFN